jgi:transposase
MSDPLVPDDLWEAIEPLLPKEPPKPKGGRPRVPERAALGGIIFVLRTGCPWRLLPQELGCGSGVTCWRRLRDWQADGVWEKLHQRLLNWLGDEAAVDWRRANLDSLGVRAKRGAKPPARTRPTAAKRAPSTTWSWTATASRWRCAFRPPTPTTQPSSSRSSTPSRPSSARAASQGGHANVRPRKRPAKLHADKAYDSSTLRRALRIRGIMPRIARRGIESSERLGRHRWVVERTFAWLLGCRRLGIRYDRRADLLQGLLHLACSLICIGFLGPIDGD